MSNNNPQVAKMEAQMHEWRAKIDVVKARLEIATADGRIELAKQVESFETHYGEANKRFNEVVTAGEDKVAAVVAGIEKGWEAFKAEFDKA